MKISEMIEYLQVLQSQIGDQEVLITDGFNARCYRGDYSIVKYTDIDGTVYADIGIGGCLEDD